MGGRAVVKATGKRILVVEDEYILAESLARDFWEAGVEVIGPVPTIAEALNLIAAEPIDGAVLNIKLRDGIAYLIADELVDRGIPLVFATGYSADELPARYAAVPLCEKPVRIDVLITALFPG